MAEKKEKLFDMFPPISTEEWVAKINADLKGADFDKKLVWRTNEGFDVQPFYRAEDTANLSTVNSLPGEFPYIRGTRTDNNWLIRQEILGDTAEAINAAAIHAIDRGVDSIAFKAGKDFDAAALETILKGIDLNKIEVNINCCPGCAVEVAKVLVAYVKANGLVETFRGSINFNPMKRLLKHGLKFPKDLVETAKALIAEVKEVRGIRCIAVDSFMLNNAGAFISQELGYALAWGAQWMTSLTEAGLCACEVASRIKFNMGISSNYFMELAKFRAGRMLWAEIVNAYEPKCEDACKMMVHAVTSQFNMTIFDAHVNMLRSMTETMSAALAGVDSIETLPFDLQYKRPDEFSERIARNQQLLLREESHLNKVVDPAGGSYYVEVLTVSIAEQAWKLFNEVEDNGGFLAQLEAGEIQKAVNASGVKRHTDVARRKEILLGTNQYPNFTETALEKIDKAGCCCCCSEGEEGGVEALKFDRAGSEFEDLRLATERSGKRPKVFMLTIGNLAMRLARAQFSSNFFGCAGIRVIDNTFFKSIEEGVEAALASKAEIVVVCASDDDYAEAAPKVKELLGDQAILVVAGAPACAPELEEKGIKNFISVKSNVLDTLKFYLKEMGI